MADRSWRGPWDCAEFASWCVFQATGVLYGVEPRQDPILADAFTGFWGDQALEDQAAIAVEDAARIVGACLLRLPASQRVGHIVISDGEGGTVEAHSSTTGVIRHRISNRRWDFGVLVPGVRYLMQDAPVAIEPPRFILRLTSPMTRGPRVAAVQEALIARGFSPGAADGVYGPQTESAVQAFQERHGLVPDGEVGEATWRALGLS
ncbi:MAG TPA: peptidoglycan-binding domain-containing protein [Geminicoccaceae bacterium]